MEDNVKGLIRTCCIVLVISVGLSVVYSAKRPYIYLIENYDHYYTPPSPEHPQRTIRTRDKHDHDQGRPSGNNYNSGFYYHYPFLFQQHGHGYDIHRNGEVTGDVDVASASIEAPEPLSQPPTVKRKKYSKSRQKISDGENNHNNVRKSVQHNEESFTATTISPSGETLSFPIPWEWKARMEQVKKTTKTEKNKKEEKKDADPNTEDRKFRLPRLPTLPPFPTIDFKFETSDSEAGRRSRSHNPNRSQSSASKQIQFADIISPETLSFISKLQKLNVTKLAANAANSGTNIISLNAGASGSEELTLHSPSVGTPLLSGDFLNLESTKPLIIPKDTASNRPSAAEIEAYHKLKNKFNKPASPTNRDSEEDEEQEEVEDDEAEDDTSAGEVEASQQQTEEEIGSKSKESKEEQAENDQAEADTKEEEQEQGGSVEEQEQAQSDEPTGSKEEEQEQEQAASKEEQEQVQSDEEELHEDDEEIAHDSPLRTKKKTKRPTPVRRPSDTYALASLPQSLQSYSYTRPKQNHSVQYQHDNLFESAHVQPDSTEQQAKPVIILVNVPKPTGLKGETGGYYDNDYAYGDEDKKAEKKAKKAEKKKKFEEKKKKKKEKKKKKKQKKKGWPKKKKKKKKAWGPPTTMRPNKKADIINRLTKVHSNVQEIFQTFKGVISDYVINRPHVGIEFTHTNRGQPPPHRRPPPPKKAEDEDDDDEEDWKKEKSGEDGGEKSGEGDGDEHEHDREKSDDRKLRLPGSGSYEDFVEDNHYVAVGGKPTIWNPAKWSFNYPSSSSDGESSAAASLSKRLQECQKNGRLADCASLVVDRPGSVKYRPPEPIYVESMVSTESGEKPPRPPFREPPPRITTGNSEKVWVKTWDKEHTGLPLPIESAELNKG